MGKATIAIWFMVGMYFGYFGVVTKPWEGDSLAYHIPIARIISEGRWGDRAALSSPLYYYPGGTEAMLAVMMRLGLPLNLFNVAGGVALVILSREMGKKLGMERGLATIFGISVGMWPSVIRLIMTQTVDIWLAVFWVWVWLLLCSPGRNWKYWGQLGVATGMLIGSKYSGILFAVIMFGFYGRGLVRNLSWRAVVAGAVGVGMFGLFWYIRNWALTGDPVYPATFWFWVGDVQFKVNNWAFWKTLVYVPGGWGKMAEAAVSEYLVWLPLGMGAALLRRNRIAILGLVNLAACLILPSWPENMISDLRYIYPVMIPLTAGVFLWAKEKGREEVIGAVALASIAAVLTQLDYHPKLLVLIIVIVGLWAALEVKRTK